MFACRCNKADLMQTLPIEVLLEAGPISCPVRVEPGSTGHYICTYTAQTAGSYRLLITCQGRPIAGTPVPVQVRGTTLTTACHVYLALMGATRGILRCKIAKACGRSQQCSSGLEHRHEATCAAGRGMDACNALTSVLLQVAGEQRGPDPADPPATIRDESKVWETIAAAQYKLDGNDAGWESDVSDEETADDKYIRVRASFRVEPLYNETGWCGTHSRTYCHAQSVLCDHYLRRPSEWAIGSATAAS